ncbi:COG4315 family predicted lipoprotein [Microvirga alba]|uniref:Lipoprotein with Yx(FWY)xxD motif n=1 Tax=Microvirga alba TaxID=2791025 RepID=A0A931BRE0_9HYPH|nr:hypothetical protein [Microvirga alba]MBF9233399.1 hypothetical protein [Microvirga alba]
MLKVGFVVALLAGAVLGAQPAFAQAKVGETSKGKTLVDGRGMTLYVYDRDTPEKSNCNGACAQNWPPLTAAADAKTMERWTIIVRDDGTRQWAYQGKPLYSWAKDSKPGDVTGDGVANAWHVAQP